MAIKSPLNLGVISPERRVTPTSVQNFISGGAPLGSSVVTSAANKIVGFQRGAAGVAPQVPDLGSIIQTLSSNILNNVENRVQSINQVVNQYVTQKLDELGNNFNDRIQKLDAATPNKILSNFLQLYKSAIDYIRFFADPTNVRRLGENIQSLQKIFEETFEVAKKIRKTIIRVVDQLSSLPTANVGGSGINLDVDVPGGGLKRSAPRGLMRAMRRRPGMMLGGAALVGAGAGTLVTSALSDVGGGTEGVVTTDSMGLSQPMLEKFNEILDRFSKAINSLSTKRERTGTKSGGGGGTTVSQKPKESPLTSGGTSGTGIASDVTADTKEETAWLQTIRAAEGTAGPGGYGKVFGGKVVSELEQGKLTIEEAATMSETGKLPDRLGGKQIAYGKYRGQISGATGAYQFMPGTLRSAAKLAKIDLNTPMTPEVQDKLALAWLTYMGIDPTKKATEATIRKAGSSAGWAGIHGEATGQTSRTVAQSLQMYNKFYGSAQVSPQTQQQKTQETTKVSAAPTQASVQQQIAQQVSQPPAILQSPPQVTVLPISGNSNTGSRGMDSQVPMESIGAGKQTLPFLSSTNSDNFLTLYSKMVYNIVDG